MDTYKQNIKEESREKIWEHAVYSLTANRSNNRVLNEEYIRNLWNYIFYKSKYSGGYFKNTNPDINYLNSWCEFANSCYGDKKSNQLRVVYLCGPEPENDLETLLKLGISIENIWAVENQKDVFDSAIENIRNKYPMLKIFHGSIDSFFKIYPLPFDIVYLDFTAPIFSVRHSPFKTIHTIFDNQVLSEIGILITNYSMPEKSREYIEFLADFFLDQRYLEGGIHGGCDDQGGKITWFGDGCICYGYDRNILISKINENFEEAYSSFCSLYPIFYASVISPAYRVVKEKSTYKKIFNADNSKVKKLIDEEYKDDLVFELNDCPEVGFIKRVMESNNKVSKHWANSYTKNEPGTSFNRFDAIRLSAMLRGELSSRRTAELLSEEMRKSILSAYRKMEKYEKIRLFCDVIFENILSEIALNQLGFPYHPQMVNHKRFSYTAKTMKMFVDIFTFDRCRAFYDWIPLIEFYDKSLSIVERQMILRSCIDIIGGKQLCFTPIPIYGSGASVVAMFETEWAKFTNEFPERIELE